jgi:hypothetical protein
MPASRFIAICAVPAICAAEGASRSTARCLWTARLEPPATLVARTPAVLERCPSLAGRVHGLGSFADAGIHAALAAQLPCGLGAELRERFEWYACRGVGFHTDAHYGGVLFGAWCVAGPPREIAFSRAGVRVGAAVGDCTIFDPFEPHAVLDPGQSTYTREHFQNAPASLFLGFEIVLDDAARAAFGIGAAASSGVLLASSVAVNAETGALP